MTIKYHNKEKSNKIIKISLILLCMGAFVFCALFSYAYFSDMVEKRREVKLGNISFDGNTNTASTLNLNKLKGQEQIIDYDISATAKNENSNLAIRFYLKTTGSDNVLDKSLVDRTVYKAISKNNIDNKWTRIGDYFYLTYNDNIKVVNDKKTYSFLTASDLIMPSGYAGSNIKLEIKFETKVASTYNASNTILQNIQAIFNDSGYHQLTLQANEPVETLAPAYAKGGEVVVVEPQFGRQLNNFNAITANYNTFTLPTINNTANFTMQFKNSLQYNVNYLKDKGQVNVLSGQTKQDTTEGIKISVISGEKLILQALSTSDFYFDKWSNNNSRNSIQDLGSISQGGTITAIFVKGGEITAGTVDLTVKVQNGEDNRGKIKVNANEPTTSYTGKFNTNVGTALSVTAIPEKGYQFYEWLENGASIGKAKNLNILINFTKARTISAHFIPFAVDIDLLESKGDISTNIADGTKFQINGTPKLEGKTFYGWSYTKINDSNYKTELFKNSIMSSMIFYPIPSTYSPIYPVFLTPNVTATQQRVNIKELVGSTADVVLGGEVTSLYGNMANNTTLKTIAIPVGVDEVSKDAFLNCQNLTSIYLPDTAINTHSESMNGTKWLNDKQNGLVYINNTNLLTYKGSAPSTLTLKESTLSISSYAFYEQTSLTGITLPKYLLQIKPFAFGKCINLASIQIPTNVKVVAPGSFYHCEKLTSIKVSAENQNFTDKGLNIIYDKRDDDLVFGGVCQNIPAGTKKISAFAYTGTKVTSITVPNTTEIILDNAFSECKQLTKVTLSESVHELSSNTFADSTALTTVNWSAPNTKVTVFRSGIFFNCTSLTTVSFPDSVVIVENKAFQNCTSLKNITITSNITNLGESSFKNSGITTLTFAPNSKLEIVDEFALSGCPSLTSISFPASLMGINQRGMSDNPSLTSVIFQDAKNLKGLANFVFLNCPNLTELKFNGTANFAQIQLGTRLLATGGSKQLAITVPAGQLDNAKAKFDVNVCTPDMAGHLSMTDGTTTVNFVNTAGQGQAPNCVWQ